MSSCVSCNLATDCKDDNTGQLFEQCFTFPS